METEIFLGGRDAHPNNNPFYCFISGKKGNDEDAESLGIDDLKEEGDKVTSVIPKKDLEAD